MRELHELSDLGFQISGNLDTLERIIKIFKTGQN